MGQLNKHSTSVNSATIEYYNTIMRQFSSNSPIINSMVEIRNNPSLISSVFRMEHTRVLARYEGECPLCLLPIREGEEIIGCTLNGEGRVWDCQGKCGARRTPQLQQLNGVTYEVLTVSTINESYLLANLSIVK